MFHRPSSTYAAGMDVSSRSRQQTTVRRLSAVSARSGSNMSSLFSLSGRYSSTAFDTAALNEARTSNYCRWPACLAIDAPAVQRLKRILRSRLWKFLMCFFYGFLLFGSQIHHIWAPGQTKTYNILAFVTLGFCIADMLLRILVEPEYFQFGIASCGGHMFGQTNGAANDNHHTCSFGSFLFWCDLLSTSMILYDISWINDQHFELKTITLQLDDHGFPVC